MKVYVKDGGKDRPVYHVPDWMKRLIEIMLTNSLARQLSNAEDEGLDETGMRRYSFEVTEGNCTHWEQSREKEVVFLTCKPEEVERVINQSVDLLGLDLLQLVQEYAHERDGREALPIHSCIIQVMLALAIKKRMERSPRTVIHVVHGDYLLVGRFPFGAKVDIHGNVDTIEGSTGTYLTVRGNVNHLGCGPFWSIAPMDGTEEGVLVIEGDLEGYKCSIENKKLEIRIMGSVTTKGMFLLGSNFKEMTIHGDVSANSPFPGLFSGTVVVLGDIHNMAWATPQRWSNTSAATYGHGNIFHKDRQIVSNGQLTTG